MAAFSTLTLKDRLATPANHNFAPISNDNGVALWAESAQARIGENKLTASIRTTATRENVQFKVQTPIVAYETIGGVVVPRLITNLYGEMKFSMDQIATIDQKKILVGFMKSIVDGTNPALDDYLFNGQGAY